MNALRSLPILTIAACVLVARGLAADQPQTWVADPVHSSAQFTATHFGISHVTGVIPIKSAVVTAPASPKLPASIAATLDATGIDTRNDMRDGDLRSDHFFDTAQYPTITFASTAIAPVNDKSFTVRGNLTMHGVTKPVVLNATYLGQAVDPRGHQRVAYQATASIKRSDFGMTYMPDVVGDEIDIQIDIEAVGQ